MVGQNVQLVRLMHSSNDKQTLRKVCTVRTHPSGNMCAKTTIYRNFDCPHADAPPQELVLKRQRANASQFAQCF